MANESESRRTRRDRVELSAAVLIAIAAVLTAIASYQSNALDGKTREYFSTSLWWTSIANESYNSANAQAALERDWFIRWAIEDANGTGAAAGLWALMPPTVRTVIERFSESEIYEPIDPFSLVFLDDGWEYTEQDDQSLRWAIESLESRQINQIAEQADDAAECAVFNGLVADDGAGYLDIAAVAFAITLVTAGLASLLHSRLAQNGVLAVAIIGLILGSLFLSTGLDEGASRVDAAADFFADTGDPSALVGIDYADTYCPADL